MLLTNLNSKIVPALALVGLCFLVACSEDSGQPGASSEGSAAVEQQSRTLSPADPALKAIYDRSCRNCHTIAATGAPLTGDSAAWSSRFAKGRDTLVDNVINGFGGMPPFGMCMDCEIEQFEELIDFMASADTQKNEG